MLNKDIFNKGIEKLSIEFSDRGFTMTKEKAAQWYEYMKDINDYEFKKKIDNCLMTCHHVPYMADVMDLKDIDAVRANAGAYRYLGE